MKSIFFSLLLLATASLYAQVPEGFVKGQVTTTEGVRLQGFVKDRIKQDAALVYLDETGKGKKQFDGNQLSQAEFDGTTYLCIRGDFFKLICKGKIDFLQKSSNAAGKATYNGSEAIFVSGTEGKPGDYFSYANGELTRLTKKTVDPFITGQLQSSAAAAEKARSINGNIAALAEAITIYNNEMK